MGLFSFIKNAGTKVFGIGNTTEEEATAARGKASIKAEVIELRLEGAAARNMEETINDLQLKVENLNVFVDDDMVKVSGLAYDQATKEKVILVIGNTAGVSIVDDQMTVYYKEPEA